MDVLEATQPVGQTNLVGTLHELAERIRRRALVVVLSDFLGSRSPQPLVEALGHLQHRKHEVIALQVLDPAELTFPFSDAGQIEDQESGRLVTADAEAVRRHYLDSINAYLDVLRVGCQSRQIGYALADTARPFHDFLATYLTQRQSLGRIAVR